MRIILIGNYPPDKQESMQRFAQMLNNGFKQAGVNSEIWYPKVFFGKFAKSTIRGFGKWLGYIDKYLIYPLILWFAPLKKEYQGDSVYFHVCDHSNAPYLKYLPQGRAGITCHDVLAIRGALGYPDSYCTSTAMGKILQKWILSYLSRSKIVICDTEQTLSQLVELSHLQKKPDKWVVVHIALNDDFSPTNYIEAKNLLNKAGYNNSAPFLLHVGSALPRKNRKMLLNMVKALDGKFEGNICFAGMPLDEDLKDMVNSYDLNDRVFSVVKPDHQTLKAFYTACYAFIFPSFSEGFGWPVVEAQACGAPVIASNVEPMEEVSGGAALHADPLNPQEFANAFISLTNDEFRFGLINQGFENAKKFELMSMIKSYLDVYAKNA